MKCFLKILDTEKDRAIPLYRQTGS